MGAPANPSEANSYWDDASEPALQRGVYIAVSGNTGAGKSTLVGAIGDRVSAYEPMVVNERIFHHPLLRLMFSAPERYAFGVQLNFLLQRHLFLLRALELGRVVVMERSHLDDMIFVDHHADSHHFGEDERRLYTELHRLVGARVPDPDIWMLLDAPAALSLQRVTEAEARGERPREFPSDESKRRFVESWALRYQRFFADVSSEKAAGTRFECTRIHTLPAATPTDQIVRDFLHSFQELQRSRDEPRATVEVPND